MCVCGWRREREGGGEGAGREGGREREREKQKVMINTLWYVFTTQVRPASPHILRCIIFLIDTSYVINLFFRLLTVFTR